jgi:starch synthase
MTVCFHYSRPASGSTDSEIFGFDVAVNNLLSAWFKYGSQKEFLCRPTDIPSFEHFKEVAAQQGIDAETRCIGLDPRTPAYNMQTVGCLFRPDPLTADLTWRRQQVPGKGFATCGLVHTMSGERIARAVGDLCYAPTDGTDALICPSASIRDAVRSLWELQADFIHHRFGGTFACPVLTPVIPLGIDSEKFVYLSAAAKRKSQRAALEVAEDEIVILFVGRLSFATKAHPLPLFLAADHAARISGRKVRLAMYGYFKPRDMEPYFRELAADFGRSLRIDFVTNDDARFPDGLWAAADIFTSLSDNVQESFGLTPIEAMACGLPVVVTDWDGYREGVSNGSEGFLVPTMTPPTTTGLDIARDYYNQENYGVALSGAAQSTAVDIATCTQAFAMLIADADLRKRMGDSGRQRAQQVFDWKTVIRQYEDLWLDLAEKRLAAPPVQAVPENWQAAHPAFPNPLHMFASFPTRQLSPDDILHIAMSESDVTLVLKNDMNYFVPDLLSPKETLLELIGVIRRAHAVRMRDLLNAFPENSHNRLWRCIGWLIKHGICMAEKATS